MVESGTEFVNRIPNGLKENLVKNGDIRVFEIDPEKRRTMESRELVHCFDELYDRKLARAISAGRPISFEVAMKSLDQRVHGYMRRRRSHYSVPIEGVVYIAEVEGNTCYQLWSASGNQDPTRLSVPFETEVDLDLVLRAAESDKKEAYIWAREILVDKARTALSVE